MATSKKTTENKIDETKKATGTKSTKKVASSSKTSPKGTKKATTTSSKKPVAKKTTNTKTKEEASSSKSTTSKKSLESIIKAPSVSPIPVSLDEKNTDHVSILKKKMEAQKKLKDDLLEETQPTLVKPLPKPIENEDDILDNDNNELVNEVDRLKKENEKLNNELNSLQKDIDEKEEKITILTNSIVSKTNESDLLNQIETLKQENSILKEKIDNINEPKIEPDKKEELNNSYLIDTNNTGDVILRIKLLNERIAEKEAQIKLVEEELDKLSEKDIVAESFKSKIKEVRDARSESIDRANNELENLSKLIIQNENSLKTKKEEYNKKVKELEDFDIELNKKSLNYTEREEEMKKRSRLFTEKDALFIQLEPLEDNYNKLVKRYKDRLKQAEERVEKLNAIESNLIELYLKQLRDSITDNNINYKEQKEERDALLNELNKLNKKIEDKQEEVEDIEMDISSIRKEYAKVCGKLNTIKNKYDERCNIENLILQNEQTVKDYYNAFKNREIIIFNITENTNKVNNMQNEIANTSDEENKNRLISIYTDKINSLNVIIDDDKEKVKYYTKIINQLENDEKVVFYIKLINSIAELVEAEKELKKKEIKLKELLTQSEGNA